MAMVDVINGTPFALKRIYNYSIIVMLRNGTPLKFVKINVFKITNKRKCVSKQMYL